MDKTALSKKLHWDKVMWVIGLLNVAAFLPQLWQIWDTHKVAGVSIAMFSLFGFIQIAYGMNAWLRNDRGTMWGMIAAFLLTITIIGSVLYLR